MSKRALIIVDVQNDFCEGGALEVPQSGEIITVINDLIFYGKYDEIVYTLDWHPYNHQSFASQHKDRKVFDVIDTSYGLQVLWPDHCIGGTYGAELHPNLSRVLDRQVHYKGQNPYVDSYSAFTDVANKDTSLNGTLKSIKITDIDIVGLATDYCVKFTALDAARMGYNTSVLLKGCRSIDDITETLVELRTAGINVID